MTRVIIEAIERYPGKPFWAIFPADAEQVSVLTIRGPHTDEMRHAVERIAEAIECALKISEASKG
jgi:hypothetical protein